MLRQPRLNFTRTSFFFVTSRNSTGADFNVFDADRLPNCLSRPPPDTNQIRLAQRSIADTPRGGTRPFICRFRTLGTASERDTVVGIIQP